MSLVEPRIRTQSPSGNSIRAGRGRPLLLRLFGNVGSSLLLPVAPRLLRVSSLMPQQGFRV